jgi:tetratricopeptide (TPR) repeat protein
MRFGSRLRRRSALYAGVMATLITTASPWAGAQSTSDELARRHFESGVAYLEESDYDAAITAFQKAYELSKRPEILLNLATVHERKSDFASAIAALRAYLEAAPEGEHVTIVESRIRNLEKRQRETERPEVTPAPAAPLPPPPVATREEPTPRPHPSPAPHLPEPNRLPAFISLGVGGLMGSAALATGIVAQAKYDDAKSTCGRACRDDELSSSRTFALTSTVLTGAAVLGVGLGVVLLLTTPEDTEVARSAPRWDIALGPGSAAASAGWTF